MADTTLATLANALSQDIAPVVIATANRRAPLLRFLEIRMGAGQNIAFDVENDGAYAENYTDGQDVSTYGSDIPKLATGNWGLYRSNFQLTVLAASAAASSRSPMGLLRVFGRNMQNAASKLASTLSGVAYSGTGTGTALTGLDVALDDTNAYFGITRSGASYFRATVIDPGSNIDPTIALIRADIGTIQDACGEKPDLAFCSTAVWNKIAATFTEVRRYDRDVLAVGSGVVTLDATVDILVIDGCAFVKDKDATANRIYYLNSAYCYWEYLPVVLPDMEMMMQDTFDAELTDGVSPLPLGMKVFHLARTGAAEKFSSLVQCQLVVSSPKTCGIRKHVNA